MIKTISVLAIAATVCSSHLQENECKQQIVDCVKQGEKDIETNPYLSQFKPEIAKAKVVLGCLERLGYIRR